MTMREIRKRLPMIFFLTIALVSAGVFGAAAMMGELGELLLALGMLCVSTVLTFQEIRRVTPSNKPLSAWTDRLPGIYTEKWEQVVPIKVKMVEYLDGFAAYWEEAGEWGEGSTPMAAMADLTCAIENALRDIEVARNGRQRMPKAVRDRWDVIESVMSERAPRNPEDEVE